MANPGDIVKVITKEKEIEGILMPNESKDSVFIRSLTVIISESIKKRSKKQKS